MLQCLSVTLGDFLYLKCSISSLLAFACPLSVGVQAHEMLLWYCHISGLEDNIAGINKDIKSFDARLKFAADIQSVAEVGVITVYRSCRFWALKFIFEAVKAFNIFGLPERF